jgi:hypothetical protein
VFRVQLSLGCQGFVTQVCNKLAQEPSERASGCAFVQNN